MNYAVVGTSAITKEFIAAAEQTPLHLAGICSRTARRGADFAGEIGQPALPVFVGTDALAASGIPAVYIASPNASHYAQCAQLLSAGKHVLCEKPLTVSVQELEQLQQLAATRGLVLMEAIMYLQTPQRQAVLAALPRLGRINGVQIDFSQLSSRYDALLAGALPNIFNPALRAGAFNDLGVYCLYPLLDFFGVPAALHSARLRYDFSGAADTSGTALLRYEGFDAALTWSKTAQSRGVSQIMGERGTLTIRSISQCQGITFYDRAGTPTALDSPQSKPEVMRHEALAFYNAILGRDLPVAYPAAAALALQVCRWMDAIRKGSEL
jgi:predicted dehydrogenase